MNNLARVQPMVFKKPKTIKQTREELEEWSVWIWENGGIGTGVYSLYPQPDLRISAAITDDRAMEINQAFVELKAQEYGIGLATHMYYATELGYRGVAGERKISVGKCKTLVDMGVSWINCWLRFNGA